MKLKMKMKIPQISIFVSQKNPMLGLFWAIFFPHIMEKNVHVDRKQNQSIYIETNGQCMNDINTIRIE